jgi:hypothetical protein
VAAPTKRLQRPYFFHQDGVVAVYGSCESSTR